MSAPTAKPGRWALERMRLGLSEAEPGGILVVQHLAHMVVVQALRLNLISWTDVTSAGSSRWPI